MAKRELSPKQQAHIDSLVAINKRRAEEARAARSATASAEPPEPAPAPEAVTEPEPEAQDDLLAQFQALGAEMQRTGASRAERNQQLKEFEELLGKMSVKDYPEIAENPVVQAFVERLQETVAERHPDDAPGTIYNRGMVNEQKKPWQWRDLPRYGFRDPTCATKDKDCPNCGGHGTCIEMVGPVTPNESKMVTWNGLRHPIVAGEQQWLPKPHYEVYIESQRQRRAAEQHARVMFRQADIVTADPTIVGAETTHVRGWGRGSYLPGQGGFNPFEKEEGEA